MRIPYRKPGKYSKIQSDPVLTKEKEAEIKRQLDRLKNTSRPTAAAEVSRLAELGDFSENVEYQLAKGKLRGINNAILRLEAQLNRAEIIKPQRQTDTIQIGHTVTIETSDRQKAYQILGSSETDPQKGIISHNSPIGAALVGHRVGDVVTVKLANKEVIYKIIKIE